MHYLANKLSDIGCHVDMTLDHAHSVARGCKTLQLYGFPVETLARWCLIEPYQVLFLGNVAKIVT